MMKIITVHLDGFSEESKFNRLKSCISTEKQERISRFHRFDDAQRTLIGDILIRHLLCQMLKIKNNKLIFKINKYGKPFLFNCNDIQYNISHSGKWVACAICDYPVGIDIEQIKPIDISIAEQFFSKDEVNYLMSKNIIERETSVLSV